MVMECSIGGIRWSGGSHNVDLLSLIPFHSNGTK